MKKLIIAGLILGSVACVSFASNEDQARMQSDAHHQSDWSDKSDWQHGQSRFVAQLNLDPERAARMELILSSYREVPKLYFTNQTEKIPEFLAQKEAELAALLTPEELAQFKQAFAEWAKKKNFKFMKFSANQPQLHNIPALELDVSEQLREEVNAIMKGQLIEIRQQLRDQSANA